jgi:hypothetical protein
MAVLRRAAITILMKLKTKTLSPVIAARPSWCPGPPLARLLHQNVAAHLDRVEPLAAIALQQSTFVKMEHPEIIQLTCDLVDLVSPLLSSFNLWD